MPTETTPTFNPNEIAGCHPALVGFGDPPSPTLRSLTWAGAMREIESILSWVITHDGTYVTFIVESRANRFVQARSTDDGKVFIETTGDEFTDDEPYEVADRIHLVRLGWQPEAPCDDTPNWWREADPRWFYAQPMMAELLVRTLVDVHHATGPADIGIVHGVFEPSETDEQEADHSEPNQRRPKTWPFSLRDYIADGATPDEAMIYYEEDGGYGGWDWEPPTTPLANE